MAVFETDNAALMWNATSVTNAFLMEYMPSAPEGHVKVYLYCLMLLHSGQPEADDPINACSLALGLSIEAVKTAMRYWERCRLVERISTEPLRYRFLSMQQALNSRDLFTVDEAYQEFSQAVYAMFQDKRKLNPTDVSTAYEWVESLKLPTQVVLMLLQHMIATHGLHFSFAETAQKTAAKMAESKITGIEEAEAFFALGEKLSKGTKAVLRRLGIKHEPSEPEMEMYGKWLQEWGFEPKAILTACNETVKGSPTFAYLNKILENLHIRLGTAKHTEQAVGNLIEQERLEGEHVRELLAALGISSSNVDEGQRALYRSLAEHGGHEMVMLAAKEVVLRSRYHTLDKVGEYLMGWNEQGLFTPEDVRRRLDEIELLNARLKELLKLAGKTASGVNADSRALLEKWRNEWKLSDALCDTAAVFAKGADKPVQYMDKLLGDWLEKGILTPEAAQLEHERHVAEQKKTEQKPAVPVPKTVIEQKYNQRSYAETDFSGLSPAQLDLLNEQESAKQEAEQ